MGGTGTPQFDWPWLISRLVHPIKVAILETLASVEAPLSPSELVSIFDQDDWYLSKVAYHARKLETDGALEEVDTRRVRGALEHFYAIPSHLLRH
jgi:hypothetical protein